MPTRVAVIRLHAADRVQLASDHERERCWGNQHQVQLIDAFGTELTRDVADLSRNRIRVRTRFVGAGRPAGRGQPHVPGMKSIPQHRGLEQSVLAQADLEHRTLAAAPR